MENADSPLISATPFSFGGYALESGSLEGVEFWPRVAARGVDLVVHYLLAFVGGFSVGFALRLGSHGHPYHISFIQYTHLIYYRFFSAVLGAFVFQVVCIALHGSTPGKLALGMVVVQEDGTPCRFTSALIREAAYFIDAMFFGVIGYLQMQKSLREQRHGDNWAHTIVCKRTNVQPHNLHGAGLFVAALALAAICDISIMITGTVLAITS